MTKSKLLYHTVRHLRPVQVTNRILRGLRRPRPDIRPAPHLRSPSASWIAPIPYPQSLFESGAALFLNHWGSIESPDAWNDPVQAKLWLYNLHYFDDLTRPDDSEFQAKMIARWIRENPPAGGNGWEPYPTSLRIVNWIKWALIGNGLTENMRNSLAVQVRWLGETLEWHLLGNHLFANAKALVFAGLFFEGPEAESWLSKGLAILSHELPEQILRDGGHFELSPMYHSIILEDLCDLWNMTRAFGRTQTAVLRNLPDRITAMRRWLAIMSHPDGKIAFFNDSAFGIGPDLNAIDLYACALKLPEMPSRPRDPITYLADSGYIRVDWQGMTAFIDVAAVGPDYIPGHAHADTLSFELSLGQTRIFVNGGVSTYEPGTERLAQRETRAHNTVEVEGVSSSEVWSAFRVARRAKVFDLKIDTSGDRLCISAGHSGYKRLSSRVAHHRSWTFTKEGLTVEDHVTPATSAIARLRLAPGVTADTEPNTNSVILKTKDSALSLSFSSLPRVATSTWHPEFGVSVETRTFELPFTSGNSVTNIKLV